jgi:predicted secreted hydrolase
MKNSSNALSRRVFSRVLVAAPFAIAKPGYRYAFPRDHYAHPEFRTEWWYYTGNLFDAARRRFGFELTFFRQAQLPPPNTDSKAASKSAWSVDSIWLAHLALSDIEGKRFLHQQRLNRSGPGLAGADAASRLVWNGNWQARPSLLRAVHESFTLDLKLASSKAPVIHGVNGISQKARGPGRASHYISETRNIAQGTLRYDNRTFTLKGLTWMDHEFFTHQLEGNQAGWDWLSIQLDDNTELMLFQLRRRDGSIDPNSAGTFIDAGGVAHHLGVSDFRLTPSSLWRSPASGARYPLRWTIEVPSLALRLDATTPLESQELTASTPYAPTYWEGTVDYTGTRAGRPIRGLGYLEMTGYDKPVNLG